VSTAASFTRLKTNVNQTRKQFAAERKILDDRIQ